MSKHIPKKSNPSKLVKTPYKSSDSKPLCFTFNRFKTKSINIDGKFNNFYKDSNEYIRKVSALLEYALPQLSNEDSSIFGNQSKLHALHLHKIQNKRNELEAIFKIYGFPNDEINSIFEGAQIFQFEVPNENGAFRVVFELIGSNIISILFLDPNHHIYFNKAKIDQSNSLFYEFCPVYKSDNCNIMRQFNTCFAFEYLDKDQLADTYFYNYSPN